MNIHTTSDLMSKAEFARHCGVSGARITHLTKPGEPLWDAMNGRYINALHPDAVDYFKLKAPEAVAVPPVRKTSGMPSAPPPPAAIIADTVSAHVATPVNNIPAKKPHVRGYAARNAKNAAPVNITFDARTNPEDFLDMSLRELTERFGTDRQFLEWLKAVKSIEDIREKRLRNAEKENQYLPRDMVQKVISEFVRCFNLQLTDGSKTIVTQVRNMTKAGQSVEACITFAQDRIGNPITDAKKRIADHLVNRDVDIK